MDLSSFTNTRWSAADLDRCWCASLYSHRSVTYHVATFQWYIKVKLFIVSIAVNSCQTKISIHFLLPCKFYRRLALLDITACKRHYTTFWLFDAVLLENGTLSWNAIDNHTDNKWTSQRAHGHSKWLPYWKSFGWNCMYMINNNQSDNA